MPNLMQNVIRHVDFNDTNLTVCPLWHHTNTKQLLWQRLRGQATKYFQASAPITNTSNVLTPWPEIESHLIC